MLTRPLLVRASRCSCIHCWSVLPRLRMNKASSSSVLLLVVAAVAVAVVVVVAPAALTRVFATGRGRGRGRADMTAQWKEPRVGKSTFAGKIFLSRACHVTHIPMAELVFKKSKSRAGQRTRERDTEETDETRSESPTAIASKVKSKVKRSKAKSKLSFGVDEVGAMGSSIMHGSPSSLPRTMKERHSS